MDFMSKAFRGRVMSKYTSSSDHNPSNDKMATSGDNVRWPSIAGPTVPENNPKLWKTPRLDMSSSLAFLRRELAAMQLQDRGIHKQLLALNSTIRELKTVLNESWESEDVQSLNHSPEVDIDREVLGPSLSTPVSHAKQDSGILIDEETDEECDIFEAEPAVNRRRRSQSVPSEVRLSSGFTSVELDINQNIKPSTKGYHGITARTRSHTVNEGQFNRVTSMPVINEIPASMNDLSFSGKAFAISGYVNKPITQTYTVTPNRPLSRHGSMPMISNIGRTSVQHVASEAINRGIHKNFSSTSHVNRTNKKPLYKIWRSSSQVSLV